MFEYIGTIINSNHLQLVHIRRAKRSMYAAHVHNPMCVCNVACNYSRLKKKKSPCRYLDIIGRIVHGPRISR